MIAEWEVRGEVRRQEKHKEVVARVKVKRRRQEPLEKCRSLAEAVRRAHVLSRANVMRLAMKEAATQTRFLAGATKTLLNNCKLYHIKLHEQGPFFSAALSEMGSSCEMSVETMAPLLLQPF